MNARPPNDPPVALKIAVVGGLATLIIGVAGAIYLRWIEADDLPSPEIAVVKLTNIPAGIELQVTATWNEREKVYTEEGQAGTEEGIWSFHRAPMRQALTLTVRRVKGGVRSTWVQRSVALDWREPAVIQLPDP